MVKYKTKKIPIYEVKENDYINSFNIETEQNEFKEVLTTMTPTVEKERQLKVIFDNGESYITSRTHPTLVKRDNEYIYIKTEEVVVNDITITSEGNMAVVKEIDSNPDADENFIDIEVDGNNNYFCSTKGDLFHVVHNSRPGAITLGLDWWHMDIFSFLDMKSELNGDLRDKAFDIFPQIIVDKWFVEKERADEDVILFNHYEYKKQFGVDVTELIEEDLYNVHKHVEKLVSEGKFPQHRKVRAKELWKKGLWTWIEIGDFYIVNKDKLNSSNYLKYDPEGGITKQANLCLVGDTLVDIKVNNLEYTVRLDEIDNYMKDTVYVKSYNIETNKVEWKECYEFLEMGESSEIYEIEDEKGNIIECTGDHKIYTKNRGYVKASEVIETDILVS